MAEPAEKQEDNVNRATIPNISNTLGILVTAFNRPYHLQAVLESIRLQNRLDHVHVWIDGTQGRGEFLGANDKTVEIARRFPVAERREHKSHLGIEKLMIDALEHMTRRYDRVLVLEDDCFPLEGGIDLFEKELDVVKSDSAVFSVYGHHFKVEPYDDRNFTRFQGWGWAAFSDRLRNHLPRLRALFLMNELTYCRSISTEMTNEIAERLDVTPGRDVCKVLTQFFSWDSATAFITAQQGLVHRRTKAPAVINTGIIEGIGHFRQDTPRLRRPPFNMITLSEAWDHYDQTTLRCDFTKSSYGLDGLDLKIMQHVDCNSSGFFVEIGAFDGVTQSNSAKLEEKGWDGLLIEASPGSYAKCVRSRPGVKVVHALCLDHAAAGEIASLTDVGLMSVAEGSDMDEAETGKWLTRGESFTNRPRQVLDVPAATLSSIFDNHGVMDIDILLLDVEGSEISVLRGLDFSRHAPKIIVAEDTYTDNISEFLSHYGYHREEVLLERRFTRDCLYRRQ